MHKILFVLDRLELKHFEFNNLVTNFWLVKELLRQGQELFVTTIDKLGVSGSKAYCSCVKSFIKGDDISIEKEFLRQNIEEFQLVLFRPDPPVDLDFINATYVFDFVDRARTLILNDTKAIRDFNEKLHANYFYDLMPKNITTASKKDIEEFLEVTGEIILKPLNQCFGAGVMYLKKGDKNTNSIINTMTKNQTNLIMVQKYIPSVEFGDKRVFTLGDEVLDECVMKLPTKNDFKFNTHSDEFVKKATLSESEKQKFSQVAKTLNKMGIFMAGLDVIDEQIIEINVTSPCYFIKEVNNYFDTNLEKKIVGEILNKVNVINFSYV